MSCLKPRTTAVVLYTYGVVYTRVCVHCSTKFSTRIRIMHDRLALALALSSAATSSPAPIRNLAT